MAYYQLETAAGSRAAVLSFGLQGDIAGCGLSSINSPTLSSKDLRALTYKEIEEYVISRFLSDIVKASTVSATSAFVLVEANPWPRNPVHIALQSGKAGQIINAPWMANAVHDYTVVRPYIWIPNAQSKYVLSESSYKPLWEKVNAAAA